MAVKCLEFVRAMVCTQHGRKKVPGSTSRRCFCYDMRVVYVFASLVFLRFCQREGGSVPGALIVSECRHRLILSMFGVHL